MEETTIDLKEYFQILMKRIWLILLVTFLATATSGIVSFFVVTPIYEASTQILVNKGETNKQQILAPDMNDIQTNLKLIETYNVIIKSPRILEVAIADMKLNLTTEQLSGKIKVNTVQNSQVMSITVSDPDPMVAVDIANGIARTFQKEIKEIMNVDNVQVLAEAKKDKAYSPVKPQPLLNMVIAFVVGLMTSVGIVFLLEYLDNTLKTEQDIERVLGLPVLGSIATMEQGGNRSSKKGKSSTAVGGNQFEI